MKQLGLVDAAFLYAESPHSPVNATTIWVYSPAQSRSGQISFERLLNHVGAFVGRIPPLHKKVMHVPVDLDLPWWADDHDFELEYHVRHIALPAPGDWRQFCIQAARIHARPLDLTRPLWELYLVEGLDHVDRLPRGSFALILKVHHAAIDGKASMAIAQALHSASPSNWKAQTASDRFLEPVPARWQLLAKAAMNGALRPMQAAKALTGLLPGLRRLRSSPRADNASSATTPATRFSGAISPHRVIDTRFVDLDELKRIRKSVAGATINDVVLAVFGGALRSYLVGRGELPTEALRAMTPVALRANAAENDIGNQISAMVVSLATDVEDPLERLTLISAGTQSAKHSAEALGETGIGDFLAFVPAVLMAPGIRLTERLGRLGVSSGFNTVVSNVAGSKDPLYLFGCRMERSTGAGPLIDGLGLLNYVTSYAGTAGFGFTACRAMMPDPDFYSACIFDAFAAMSRRARSARRT